MNIAAIQALGGMNRQTAQTGIGTGTTTGNKFGSVFGSIAANNAIAVAPTQIQPTTGIPVDAIQAIFNATTVEELEIALQGLRGEGEGDISAQLDLVLGKSDIKESSNSVETEPIQPLDSISSLGSLQELANVLGTEPEKFIESLLTLLKKAGLSDSELSTVGNTNDIWMILDKIDKVAPQFFAQLASAFEGKGEIPPKQAVEVLALLKTVELVAPKTDLFMKQEQQVFALQGFLAVAGERFENVLNSATSTKNSMVQWMDARRQPVQFAVQTNSGQQMMGDGTTKNGSETQVVTMESRESSQQAVSGAPGNATVVKGEFTITENENRSNNRNEALIREMQAVFKRANFGQTPGTNRLLIKLYPEHLGQLRIELLETNGILTARILASTALGKEMLDSQMNQLRNAFLQQNLQVERIDVSQTLQEQTKNDKEQNAFKEQFRGEQQSDDQHGQADEDDMTFQEFMIELEA